MEPVSIVGPWGNDWMFISPEGFASEYPSWYSEFNTMIYGGDKSSGDESVYEEMSSTYFIANKEMEFYAAVVFLGEEYSNMAYLIHQAGNDSCLLIPNTMSGEENFSGYYISNTDEANPCKYLEENGWSYAAVTIDEETLEPVSIVGPWGNELMLMTAENFASEYPYEFA